MSKKDGLKWGLFDWERGRLARTERAAFKTEASMEELAAPPLYLR
jgi:hypothetical protein